MNRFLELDDLTWWRVKPRPSGRGAVNALQWEQELKEKIQ